MSLYVTGKHKFKGTRQAILKKKKWNKMHSGSLKQFVKIEVLCFLFLASTRGHKCTCPYPSIPPKKFYASGKSAAALGALCYSFFFIIILIIQFHSSSLQVQRLQGRCEQQERQLRTLREELRKTSLGLEAFIITTQHYCLKVGHLDNAMRTLSKTNIVQYHVKYILHLPIHACILLSSSCLPPSRPHR